MKKLLLLFICCLGAMWASGQGKATFSPAAFTAEDEVTITLDVTGTPMEGANDVYIWIFSNDNVVGYVGKGGNVNGEWANSSEQAKMIKTTANIFTFKFTGTTLFGQSPAELANFGFLGKSKDGSKQTPDYKPYKFDPLVFTPAQFRVFPAKMDFTDMTTVYFHQDLAAEVNLKRMSNVKVDLTFYGEDGKAVVGSKQGIVTVKESNILFSYSFIPERVITIPAGTKLSKFTYQFSGIVKDANGLDVSTAGPVNEVVYTIFN